MRVYEVNVRRGHLYLANLAPRYGTEAGKLRPVVVLQNDFLNIVNHPSTWVIPCTTKILSDNILRVNLPRGCAGNDKECDVMIDQSRAIDNKRFKKLLGVIPRALLAEIEEKMRQIGDL